MLLKRPRTAAVARQDWRRARCARERAAAASTAARQGSHAVVADTLQQRHLVALQPLAARALESERTSALAASDAPAATTATTEGVPLPPSRLGGWGKAASPALETGRILEYVRRTGMCNETHKLPH